MAKTFYNSSEVTKEIIARSIVLFREYHGLYEDDYEGLLWYDPVAKKFGSESWTTAAYCGLCHNTSDFGYHIETLLKTGEHADWVEEIKNSLREYIASDETRDQYFNNGNFSLFLKWNQYDKYSYQKEAAEAVTNELYSRWSELWNTVDNFYILLYYTPEASTGSYKNDKDSIVCRLKGVNFSISTMFLGQLENKLVPKRKRAVKFEGEHFEGEVISMRREHITYGYRSDWHYAYNIGIKCEDRTKTVWFKLKESSITDKLSRGSKIELFGKIKGEYERSIQINYVKVKSVNDEDIQY